MGSVARKKGKGIPSPLKWHGGKSYLASRLIDMMPARCRNPNKPADDDPGWLHYVEPFFGGGNVLLTMMNPEGIGEVANDIYSCLTNFWDVLKSQELFLEFQRLASATECSQVVFERALAGEFEDDPVSSAMAFFVLNRQSRQALGKGFATLAKTRTRRGMNELPSAWLSAVEGLPEVHERLQRVVILNDDAIKVIKQQDGPRTLFYLDPPYVPDSRTVPKAYRHEMTIEQHEQLLNTLTTIKGRFLLSGYGSDLYHKFAQAHGWSCDSIEIDNKASGEKVKGKEREFIWCNFSPSIRP